MDDDTVCLPFTDSASGEGADDSHDRNTRRQRATGRIVDDSKADRRVRGVRSGGTGDWSWLSSKWIIDERHRGAAEGRSRASSTVRDPYDEEQVDSSDEVDVDDSMAI